LSLESDVAQQFRNERWTENISCQEKHLRWIQWPGLTPWRERKLRPPCTLTEWRQHTSLICHRCIPNHLVQVWWAAGWKTSLVSRSL
jgi:hypothetical protein